jgi:hypothetical protein
MNVDIIWVELQDLLKLLNRYVVFAGGVVIKAKIRGRFTIKGILHYGAARLFDGLVIPGHLLEKFGKGSVG